MSLQQLRCLRQRNRCLLDLAAFHRPRRFFSAIKHETDSCGIPRIPTWSVHELLSSYSAPKLSSTTINRLYKLSALIPPQESAAQYENMARDLQEMVRLVEAVRLVDTRGVSLAGRGETEDADEHKCTNLSAGEENGQTLLKLAARSEGPFYVVDAERRR